MNIPKQTKEENRKELRNQINRWKRILVKKYGKKISKYWNKND